MKVRILALILTATLMTVLLPISSGLGPVQPPVDTQTLYVGEEGWGPIHADPARAYDSRSEELIFNVYDRLLSLGSPMNTTWGTLDVEEQYWEFEPALATNVPSREEHVMTIPDTGINPYDPVSYWVVSENGTWLHIEGWIDNNPDGILGYGDVLYLGAYTARELPIQQAIGIETWHVLEFVPGDHLLVHHYSYGFIIRTSPVVNFFDSTGAAIDTFDISDVEYSFERGLVQDQYGSPMWTFYKALFDQMSSDWLDRLGLDPAAASYFLALLIERAIETTPASNILTINVGIPFSDISFKQIISGTWASTVSEQWCVDNGCWNGNLFEDVAPADGILDFYQNWRHISSSPIQNVAPENYVGTGPYHLTVASEATGLVIMERNPGHWRGWPAPLKKAYLENINIEYISSWVTRRDAFVAGQLDVCEVSRTYMNQLLDSYGHPLYADIETIVVIQPSLSLDSVFFTFAVNPTSPSLYTGQLPDGIPADFFTNVHVRKAFAYAFNRAAYLANAWKNEATCRDTPSILDLVPDYYLYGPDPPWIYDYDLAKVVSELQAAMFTQDVGGVPTTKSVWDWGGFKLDMFYNAGNAERRIACEMISSTFASITQKNFIVDRKAPEWPVFENSLETRMMPLFVAGWQGDYADADNFKRSFMHSQGFFPYHQGYASLANDQLIDLAVKTPDGSAKANMYYDLDDIYIADCPSLPIAQVLGRKWMKYYVKGWHYNALYGGSLQAFQGTCDYYYKMYKEDACWADITSSTYFIPEGICNMRDISFIASRFGAKAPDLARTPPYDPRWALGTYGCGGGDVFGDRKVDMRDIGLTAAHFSHTTQP